MSLSNSSFANTTSFSSGTITASPSLITSSPLVNTSCSSCVIALDFQVLQQVVWFTETWSVTLDTEYVTVTSFNGSNATAAANTRTILGDVASLDASAYPYSAFLFSVNERNNGYFNTTPTLARGTDGSVGTTSFPYGQAFAEVRGINVRYTNPNDRCPMNMAPAIDGPHHDCQCLMNTWFPPFFGDSSDVSTTTYSLDRTYYQPLPSSQNNELLTQSQDVIAGFEPWDGERFSAWLAEDEDFKSVLPNWEDCAYWNTANGPPAVKIPVAALTTTISTTVQSAAITSSPTAKPAVTPGYPMVKSTVLPKTGQTDIGSGGGSSGAESGGSGESGSSGSSDSGSSGSQDSSGSGSSSNTGSSGSGGDTGTGGNGETGTSGTGSTGNGGTSSQDSSDSESSGTGSTGSSGDNGSQGSSESGSSGTGSTGSQDGDESTSGSGNTANSGSTSDTGSQSSDESSGNSGNAGSTTGDGSAGSQNSGGSSEDSSDQGNSGSSESSGSQDGSGSSGDSGNTSSTGSNGGTESNGDSGSSGHSGDTSNTNSGSGSDTGTQSGDSTAGGSSGSDSGSGTQGNGETGSSGSSDSSGSETSETDNANPTAPFVVSADGHTISGTVLDSTAVAIAGTTIAAGSSPMSAGGVLISVHPGASSIAINGHSQPLPTPRPAYQPAPIATIGGQILTALPGASEVYYAGTTLSRDGPHATISNKDIYIGSSGLVIDGSSTVALPTALSQESSSADEPSAVTFTAAGHTFTSFPSEIAFADTILRSGSAAVISGTTISYGTNGLVIGTSIIPIPTPHPSVADSVSDSVQIFTLGGQTFTANPTAVAIAGTTLTLGGSAVTVSGTAISLGNSGIVIASSTYAVPSDAFPSSTTVIGGQTFTINPTAIEVGGTTLTLGGPTLTISGTAISLGSSGIVIASSTYAVPSDAFPSSTTVIGGETFTINPTAIEVGGTTLSKGGSAITVNGTAISLGSSGLVVAGSTVSHHNNPSTTASATSEGLGAIILAGFGPSSTSTDLIAPTETGALNGTSTLVGFQGKAAKLGRGWEEILGLGSLLLGGWIIYLHAW